MSAGAPPRHRRIQTLVAAITLAGACAPRVDARFAGASSAADALYVGGRYREAAAAWQNASKSAANAGDRDEALYRAAASYERAGERAKAETLLARLAEGQGDRAARAAFDRARLVARDDAARGESLRLAALRRHPNSGLAPHALRTYLGDVEARAGSAQALERCLALRDELARTELDESAGYECASLSERREDYEAARSGYLRTAERHPYPRGALWDDALTGAARCEERLGRPRVAVETLERLLAEREHSTGVGSYERSRYAEARFHIAELYRDRLGDPVRARAEFHRVPLEHETSLLGDDALFEAAVLEARAGDTKAACATEHRLRERYPESRFIGCGRLVCAGAEPGRRGCPAEARRLLE